MRHLLPIALLCCVLVPATLLRSVVVEAAQQPAAKAAESATPPDSGLTTLSVQSRLVTLPAVVRDKKGALVTTLHKEDFALKVDGKEQSIRYFDRDAKEPLTLGLLVDTSQSQRSVLDEERVASKSFLQSMLDTERDKAFIAQFARQTELLQDLTNSRPKLQAALQEIDSQPDTGGGSGNSSNSGSNNGSGNAPDSNDPQNQNGNNGSNNRRGGQAGTVLYDALFLGSDELMAKQRGRKAIIILSDGVDNGSKESLARSIEAAQKSDTMIYAIYFKGEQPRQQSNNNNNRGGYPGGRRGGMGGGFPPMGGGGYPGGGQQRPQQSPQGPSTPHSAVDGKKTLQRMCDETGGRFFEVTKKETVADIYKQIGEELRAQYRLGYTPSADSVAEGYHQIDLSLVGEVAKTKDTLQTRDGYYGTGK